MGTCGPARELTHERVLLLCRPSLRLIGRFDRQHSALRGAAEHHFADCRRRFVQSLKDVGGPATRSRFVGQKVVEKHLLLVWAVFARLRASSSLPRLPDFTRNDEPRVAAPPWVS
jgi:hypothetical protein